MSLLSTYLDDRYVVMVSDSHMIGRAGEQFPKFQAFHDLDGQPIFFGATGLHQPIAQLFCIVPKMLREVGLDETRLENNGARMHAHFAGRIRT